MAGVVPDNGIHASGAVRNSFHLSAVVAALAACVHVGFWVLGQERLSAPDMDGRLASVSYSPYARWANPVAGDRPDAAQIRSDLKLIAAFARAIRIYASTHGVELVVQIANEVGLKVTVGAQIDAADARARNETELRAAIELARKNRNVNAVMVGNETLYRGIFRSDEDIDAEMRKRGAATELGQQRIGELIRMIDRTKQELQGLRIPVSTGEIWSGWFKYPELVSHVDFIAAHILPYWDGFPEYDAAGVAIGIYDRLRQTFPGKRIVIAEFGWPSAGYNRMRADPGQNAQAMAVRNFVAQAEALRIEYNLVEAFDQPWKALEGSVGPYWGLFDAMRQQKFAFTGPVIDSERWKIAALAVVIGLLMSLPIMRLAGATLGQSVLLAAAGNLAGAWCAMVFVFWNGHYFVPGAVVAPVLGLILVTPLVVIALAHIAEVAAIVFKPRRLDHDLAALHTNRRYRRDLWPDTYQAFRKERRRWAYGGVQVVKKHWRRLLPGGSILTSDLKRNVVLGWLTRLGVDSMAVAIAIFNLLWLTFIVVLGTDLPDRSLTFPILAFYSIWLAHVVVVCWPQAAIPPKQVVWAMIVRMSVQWTIAKAVFGALINDHRPFPHTAEHRDGRGSDELQVFPEALLGALLVVGSMLLVASNKQQIREIYIFAGVLTVQAVPFLLAVAIAKAECSRMNEVRVRRP